MSSLGLNGRLIRLCQKELKETLRDRRTIVTLLLMPLLVYPLLSMALNRFLLSSAAADSSATIVYKVGIESEQEGLLLSKWLEDPRSQPPEVISKASGGAVAKFEYFNVAPETAEEALFNNGVDVSAKITAEKPPTVTFIAFNGDGTSQMCQRVLSERMHWLRMRLAEEAAAASNSGYVRPADVDVTDVGEPQDTTLLATIVPLVLVLMTITGAVYPAIDLTAGERERGTMESLMASPVPRFYVLFAKYTAVVIVAMLTAIANLLAMFTTLWAGGLLPLLTGSEGFPWMSVLHILGLLVLFSGFFSAVLLSLTSFAKSFKEAQAYLIPVMLLSLTPGMLSLMPGVKLSGPMAIAPLVNIVILARDLLSDGADPAAAFAAIISTVVYAAAALTIAAKLFGSDAVTRTSEQSISSLFRRPKAESAVPSIQSASLMLALLVPIYFVVSNGLIRTMQSLSESLSLSNQLSLNAVALIATFGLVPLVATFLGRNRYRSTYRLRPFTWVAMFGAFLIGCGAWVLAHESFVIANAMGIGGLDESRIEQALKTLDAFTQVNPLVLVATMALTPAIIEELCFRGFLFSALSKVLTPTKVIVITSVIFGLFHVLTGNALLIERFIPTTLMGLILGWIAYRSGSVVPGMVLHFTHNALLESVAHYHKELTFLGEQIDGTESHIPIWILLPCLFTAVVGASIFVMATRNKPNQLPT
ncbi:ABC transporter permease subunit/CPBP intramembrane protease [Stieleria marina]|uniref:ABC-2 family transporter protein n=1 Tax=Stieleria marina TaxID=1930275 RepID=A0A517P159_9BACT|nr:ABC-2 family transporter protein [Planctomycetes bacterium K23_9]